MNVKPVLDLKAFAIQINRAHKNSLQFWLFLEKDLSVQKLYPLLNLEEYDKQLGGRVGTHL